jgi:hypothetical protein
MDGTSSASVTSSVPSAAKVRSSSHTLDDFKEEHFTHLSRRIQLELRDKEMIELANEAERAAEAGLERFVGYATTFNLGLDYDPKKIKGYQEQTVAEEHTSPMSSSSTGPQHARSTSENETTFHNLKIHDSSTPRIKDTQQQHTPHMDTPISSIHSTTLFLSPSVRKDSLPRVRVMTLRPIEEVVPIFKDVHDNICQHLIQEGVTLGQDVTNVEISTAERFCPKDCSIFIHPSSQSSTGVINTTHSYITNYFYSLETTQHLISNTQDSTQPLPDITCGRDYCQDSSSSTSCADISCFMIDSTIKSFFHERDRSKSTIIFKNENDDDYNDDPNVRHVRLGNLTFRLPRHEF